MGQKDWVNKTLVHTIIYGRFIIQITEIWNTKYIAIENISSKQKQRQLLSTKYKKHHSFTNVSNKKQS